jgi:hypothetical protein
MSGADAVFSFNHIFKQEISVINERRPAHARIVLESDKEAHGKEKTDSTGDPIISSAKTYSLLALREHRFERKIFGR